VEISATKHSAILTLHNLPVTATPLQLADWLWSSIGLALQERDIEIRPLENGSTNALVRVSRRSLADFLDRAVADLSFNGRRVCVRPTRREYPQPEWRSLTSPTEGREEER
jgi:hypothetical protein